MNFAFLTRHLTPGVGGGGGGRLPYEKPGRGCSSENLNYIPTGDQSGSG